VILAHAIGRVPADWAHWPGWISAAVLMLSIAVIVEARRHPRPTLEDDDD